MPDSKIEILLIEDDLREADLIENLLSGVRQPRFSIQRARSLAEAVALLQKRLYGLVLVDLGISGCPGLEAALSVRREASKVPIIALAVLQDAETALRSQQLDIQDYLVRDELTAPFLCRSIQMAIGRKEGMDSLRESENRYRTLFNSIEEGFCIIEVVFDAHEQPIDYRFLYTNPVFERLTGLSGASGKSMRELATGHEEHWFEIYGKIAVTGEPVRFQNRTERLNRWFDVFAFRFGPPEKRQVAVHFDDITERKLADEKLRESEAKFSKAFHAAPILISISTLPDGRYIDANEEFLRTLEYAREEIIGHTSFELGIWETPDDRELLVRRLRQNTKVRDFETRLRSKSGSPIAGLLSLEIVEIEGTECLLTITRDISDLRKAEEERSRLVMIVESSDDAIIGKTPEGFITSWNKGAEKIYGYSALEVKGRHISLLAPANVPDEIPRILEKIRRGEVIERLETTRIRKDGRPIPVALTISPIRDEKGSIVGASTIARDISERKRAEQEIVRLNADLAARAVELESANRDLEAFNYTVAHDLRQPLTVISSYCQAIETLCGGELHQECQEYVRGVYLGALRMNRLIEALLQFSSLAHAELRRTRVDLSALAQELTAELMLAEPARKVELHIAEALECQGDPGLLRVVLQNLLGNAWKYTGKKEQAVIAFEARQIEGRPVFLVRDNGAGFDESQAGRLFAPFQRLPGAEQFRGFGIGLATVARIIERHGGTVWAEGKPGLGASFYFTLPTDGAQVERAEAKV